MSPAEAALLITEISRLAALQAPLMMRVLDALTSSEAKIIPITEAAEMINRSRDWIEKRPNLRFIRRDEDGRLLGCSRSGVREFIRNGSR